MSKIVPIAEGEVQGVLERVRVFVDEVLIPMESKVLGKPWAVAQPLLDEKRRLVRAEGLWMPQVPRAYGGMGLSLWAFGQVMEWLGRTPYGIYVFNCQAPDAGNMEILMEFGTPAQKARYLEPLLEGHIRSCFSMTEPDYAGSNPVQMGTKAVQAGDQWVINGHKWFTTAADGADFAIVMCLTDPDAENPYARASQIIVPTNTPGFELLRNISLFGHAGDGWASHSEIKYTNCRVPLENVLGKAGAGFAIAQTRLGPGRIHHCMRWIGICERAFDMMCRRALDRELKPGQNLASKQTIQNWIAESRAEINAARLMVLDTARKIDSAGTKAAKVDISLIKFYCAKVLQRVLDRAVQVHGALGLTDDTPLAFWYAHERGARIYDGADEVHKSRVAREILKTYQS